ncbi:MAG: hypothetical protein H3C68_06775 [Deltaproteobacteria bacterium]|nr:hypothetical protein [Deltaproteobacteria bacterium]MBZ0219540.1 hypothetical protein [Deltaproteobacteria bacterium]
MDTFIVRIYRRDKEGIAGLVESVEGGEKRNFNDIEGLLGVLKIDIENLKLKKNTSPPKA